MDALTDEDRHALYRRSLVVVVVSQVFGGAGLAAGVTVGGLLAQDMLGNDSLAGLPAALFTLGSALAAFTVGRLTQRTGRRGGLAAGFAAGSVGAAGIVTAAVADRPALLFLSLFVYGAGTATNLQARYAGTDLAPPGRRATAVSIALVSTTAGAVAGPLSVNLLGELATSLGIPALAGPFLLAAVAFAVAGLVLFVFLRPDPYLVSLRLARAAAPSDPAPARGRVSPGVAVGATVMVLTQVAMVAIMTMTPVHMRHHQHGLGQVGFVISMHIAAMFLPSLLTGRLVDRLGSMPMAVTAAGTLLTAGVVAAVSPGDSLAGLTLALVLLGLGWNFGLISGTAYIVDSTEPATRAKTQGTVDVLIALAGAGGGAASGVISDAAGFATLSLAGGLLAVLLIPVLVWQRTTRPSPVATAGAGSSRGPVA
ncbi:MFS transporter [Paractinoplanes maris]|uniref:MFS transporter n=1 Tax=Paractinoplanes maris TaxID=1734446 RepID=UPI002020D7DC|nr:MFS transporter [Actinoplanes maris]